MTETARLVIAVDSTQAASAGRDLSALERQAGTTEIGISKLAKTAAAAFAAMKLGGLVEDAVTLASRYDQLGLVMKTVGANTGRTTVELAALDQSLQKAGISAIQSRNNIIKMMSANIDLSQATKLARLAQDAAVVGNTNSSEAFERLIKGIQSAEKETLETLGLNVNFAQSYEKLAAQLGKNVDRLTTAEKTQAGVNAAMEAGKSITGAYEASLDNANKKLQSSTRYVENLKVSLGGAAQPAFGAAVDGYVGSLKLMSENVSTVSQVLETGLYVALGRGAAAVGVSVKAFAEDLVARRASASAAVSLAEAEVAGTAATLRSTAARHAAYASHVQVVAATEAHAAAELRLIAAQKASAVAGNLAAGVGGRLLGILGGPVGLAVMAGATALSFMDFGGETSALKARLTELDGPLEGLISKFTKLSKIEQVNQIESLSNDLAALKNAYAKSGEDAGGAFVESLARGMSGPRRNGVTVASGEIAVAVESVKKAFQDTGSVDWSSLLSQLSNVNGVSAEQLQIIKDLAGSREAEARKIAQVEAQLNALTGSYKANTDAASTNAIVTDTAGLQYIAGLKKQADFAGKLTEVEKVRISISKGYAGTLSKESQDQALAYAAVKDKADDAAAATKTLTSEANKQATALENQRKALKDFLAESDVSAASMSAMADAYLAGADNVRELAIQQKIEAELLKVGAGARDAVTAAVNREADAKDRLDVDQVIASMRVENANTVAQAAATLQGKDALESFNITKAMTIALSGKKISVDSEEYKQLKLLTEEQLKNNKALEAAGRIEGLVDRLNPELKLLKDYEQAQKDLNAAIDLGTDKTPLYQDALVKLGNEYQVNQSKATLWGQMTEGAVDRIDGVFADAWANIGSGADSLWNNLVKGAKQAFGEIAHMLTTKPLLASLSNWLTGTDNGQGVGSVWGKLLGGGSSSGSSGSSFGGLAEMGKTLYSIYDAVTGVGSSVYSGYASGGFTGAIQGGIGYYNGILGKIATSLSGGFTSLIGGQAIITGATAMGTAATTAALTGVTAEVALSAAATVGAEGITAASLSAAVAEGAAAIGTNIGVAGATTAAASGGIGAAISGALSSAAAMWPLAVIMGMYQSGKLYDAGVRPDAGEMWESGGSTALGKVSMLPQTIQSKAFEITDGINSKLVGGKLAAIISGSTLHQAVWGAVGKKLFGSGYETKDSGIALGVDDGEFGAQSFIQQKKKKGLISGSSKTRNIYGELDAATKDPLGEQYNAVALNAGALFKSLGFKLGEDALDGINVAWRNISTTDGSTPEWIQEQLNYFFAQVGDSAVQSISAATDAGLSGFSYAGLQTFVKNLQDVNGVLAHLNVGLFDSSVQGGFMAEQLSLWAGGIEALSKAGTAYYDAFFSDVEKSSNALSDVRSSFSALNIALPESRDGFRDMVSGIDKTTESGRQMLLTLLGMASAADAAYDIIEGRQTAYYGAFYTEAERAALSLADITKEFKDVSVTLPETRAGYRELVEAASKDSSAAGKKMYDTLMSLAGEAGSAYDILETKASAAADATKAMAETLAGNVSNAMSAVQRAVSAEQKALTAAYNARTASLNDMLQTAQSSVTDLTNVSGSLESALKSLNGTSDDAVKMLRNQAQATLQSALAIVRSGGSLAGMTGLQDALDVVSDNNTDLYSSLEDFNREQGRTANVVAELNAVTGVQLTTEQQLLKTVQDQIDEVRSQYDAQMEGLTAQLDLAQAQVDALNGVDNSVLSVKDAIAGLGAAISAAMAAAAKPSAAVGGSYTGTAGAPSASDLNSVYNSVLGRDVDPTGAAYWAGLLGSGAVTAAGLAAAIKADAMKNGEIPAFAMGGDHLGGMRLVGENGPELEVTGPSRIFNANQTAAMLKGGGDSGMTAAEVRELRREMESNATYMAKLMEAVADGIDQMANGGVQIFGTVNTKAVA